MAFLFLLLFALLRFVTSKMEDRMEGDTPFNVLSSSFTLRFSKFS